MTSYCHMQQRELQKSVWQVHWLLLPTWSESVLVTHRVLCLLGLSIHPEVTDIASVVIYVLSLMCRQCPMVIWIVTLLDRYFFVRFLSVDDPPADMLENTPRVELAMTPSTMYSPLMPLSRCFLHLIYLPIYVFFSYIYVNTCSRSRTSLTTRGCSFFGDSNRPTLFICYQGSIEKLTLLGAIYYYYYYDKN
jgi:hypothetical protein